MAFATVMTICSSMRFPAGNISELHISDRSSMGALVEDRNTGCWATKAIAPSLFLSVPKYNISTQPQNPAKPNPPRLYFATVS